MYELGLNNYMKPNEYRFKFYKKIHNHFLKYKNKSITRQQLYKYGREINMTRKWVENEIIGCLYAPFLIELEYNRDVFELTYNGEQRFRNFFDYGNYIKYEMPFKMSIANDKTKFQFFYTDSLNDEKTLSTFTEEGWSKNVSHKRLMKKTKSKISFLDSIRLIINSLKVYKQNQYNYLDWINQYGKKHLTSDNRTCFLHSRFYLKSELVDGHRNFFKELLEFCEKPVDWNGKTILVKQYKNIMKKNDINIDTKEFIQTCIKDTIIRYCDYETLTLTSTGYFILTTYFNELKNIQIVLRKYEDEKYEVIIGKNDKFLKEIMMYLDENGFSDDKMGWKYKKVNRDDLIKVFSNIYDICNVQKSFF
ncbi:hypothetical protein PV797_15770 [Clostridiaceae bacterium M8S5]|nr:hypothetical protein PV797_15770 [Clostridiaceae bacterium M8S5]